MSTATDQRWDVKDAQTGAELKVREVRAALTNGWTPTVPALPPDPAMVAPTVQTLRDEGPIIAAEMVAGVDRKPGWPVWLDELHHLHKVDKERWARLHAMLAESEARTGPAVEASPESVEWPWAEYHDLPGGRGPTIADYADSMATAPAQGQAFLAQGPAPDDSMTGRPEVGPPPQDADAERRRKALAQAANGERRDNDAVTTSKWKRPSWFTRIFDAIFPLKPRDPRTDRGA